jgi:glutamate synthase domain-containing protein 3
MKTAVQERVVVDTRGLTTAQLNDVLRQLIKEGAKEIDLKNVFGQRYIGTDLRKKVKINIYGTPGNDLGSFMEGPTIEVFGNAQDGCGNTMNDGTIIVHGHAGDITGFAMRGGKIFIRDDVGYRVAIHMKEYKKKKPTLVIGGTAQDFLGEYMAGGNLVILGLTLKKNEKHKANFIGTGMHGGVIYLRGEAETYQFGKEVGVVEMSYEDHQILNNLVAEYSGYFGVSIEKIMKADFTKLVPLSKRPYGRLYAY